MNITVNRARFLNACQRRLDSIEQARDRVAHKNARAVMKRWFFKPATFEEALEAERNDIWVKVLHGMQYDRVNLIMRAFKQEPVQTELINVSLQAYSDIEVYL